jgi:hypothetical protein
MIVLNFNFCYYIVMIYDYIVTFSHNIENDDLIYQSTYKSNIIKGDVFFGKSPYLELLYYFSLHKTKYSLNQVGKTYNITIQFMFYSYYKSFEDSLFKFLFSHGCNVV